MRPFQQRAMLAVGVLTLMAGILVMLFSGSGKQRTLPMPTARASQSRSPAAAGLIPSPPVDLSIRVARDATIQDMAKKGLPIPSNPRKYVLISGNQSLEDCVEDLGNRFTLAMGPVNVLGDVDSLSFWVSITYHAKVLRVIEEGRRSPEKVIPLLLAEIHRDLSNSLADMEATYRDIAFREPFKPEFTRDDDPKYKESREYSNVSGEFPRRMSAIGQCFYALANMDALSQARKELATFAEVKLRRRPTPFSVLLISCMVNELQKKGDPVDPELLAAAKANPLGLTARSAWNAPVDIHDPMVKVVKLNISSVRTLQVIEIPHTINIPKQEQEKLVTRFAALAKGTV